MSSTLLRTVPAVRGALRAAAVRPAASMASMTFVRGKATLPDLSCMTTLDLIASNLFSTKDDPALDGLGMMTLVLLALGPTGSSANVWNI